MARFDRIRPEVIAALTRVPSVRKQVRKVAGEIRQQTRANITAQGLVDSGDLRRSVAVDSKLRPDGSDEFRVGWRSDLAPYGPYVELGTEDTAPHPHLRPAARTVGGKAGRRGGD